MGMGGIRMGMRRIRVGMMGMWGIRVEIMIMQEIRMEMQGIRVGMMGMRGIRVEMMGIRDRNEGNQGENLRMEVELMS